MSNWNYFYIILFLCVFAMPANAGYVVNSFTTFASGEGCTGTYGNEASTDETFYSFTATQIYLFKIDVDCTGIATIHQRISNYTPDTERIVIAIYSDDGANPDELLWDGPVYNPPDAEINEIVQLTDYELSSGTYWVATYSEGGGRLRSTSSSGGVGKLVTETGTTWPDWPADLTGMIDQSFTNNLEVWFAF